uniref:Nuclear Hormone Receptor family n=1 Tax=Panagrolaimus superbus TaxID=310955 RepID=A0A914YNT0_9BILA
MQEVKSPMLKVCCICSSPSSASPHFGAISCLACAAFFRRTVSLSIEFQCSENNSCKVYYEQRIICKACRYQRCIMAGMKSECVQKRKNIKKSSKEENSSPRSISPREVPILTNFPLVPKHAVSPSTSSFSNNSFPNSATTDCSSTPIFSPIVPTYNNFKPIITNQMEIFENLRSIDILEHFVEEERRSMERRRIMFSSSPLEALLGCSSPFSVSDLIPFTVKSHNTHMRFDHLLSFEYTKNLPGFHHLSIEDRICIFKYVIMGFCALDIAYLTSQMNMVEQGYLVFTNATYSSALNFDVGWDDEDEISAEEKAKLIWPMNQKFYEQLLKPMAKINLDQVEYSALKALTLWRTCYFELSPSAKLFAKELEYGIIKGLHNYYQNREDGPERMGDVILFISNIFDVYLTIIENYKKLELFNLIKIDIFVKELLQL